MAIELITTRIVAPYFADDSDVIYVATGGSILSTSTTFAALSNRTATDNGLDIAIDGAVISAGRSAISLTSALPTSSGSDIVTIGASGLVRSVTLAGIEVTRSNQSIANYGEVHGGTSAIRASGTSNDVINHGLMSGVSGGLFLEGAFNSFTNHGQIAGPSAVFVSGNAARGINTGVISSTLFGNTVGVSGAIVFVDFDVAAFQNAGHVTAAASSGINMLGNLGAQARLENSGQITAYDIGARFSLGSTGVASLVNSGQINGISGGVHIFGGGNLHVNNTATGVIASAGPETIRAFGVLNLYNAGTIAASGPDGHAIGFGAQSALSSITNTGTISATFAAAIDASAVLTGGGLFLRNLGHIFGGYTGGAVGDFITNRGQMDGITTLDGADQLRNSGHIEDFMLLGNGNDSFDGRGGTVGGFVDGGQDNDNLRGGGEDDDLRGGTGDDTVLGRPGDDDLAGGTGRDSLSGGVGNDSLQAGADADTLTGGTGEDVFVFLTAADPGTGATADRITDYGNGNDSIDLSAFMAGGRYIAGAAYANVGISEVRYVAATGVLSGDVGGNGTVDWHLVLTNKAALTAGDFLF